MIIPSPRLVVAGLTASFIFLSPLPGFRQELRAQALATLTVEENIRAEPQGLILGRALPGTTFSVVSLEELWVEVRMEGWIWNRSIQSTDRLGFDLRVSVAPRENLRAEPSGTILARLVEGTLLSQLEEATGWTRVQRAVWIWREAVEVGGGPPTPGAGSEEPPRNPGMGPEWWRASGTGAALLSGPDGDTLALAHSGTESRVLAREGNWVRVRLEGWTWAPAGEVAESTEIESPEEVTPSEVVTEPERYRGRTVSWELQFVSLERAEKIRTDFYEGEPFLLTRAPSSSGLFVYVAIPPDRVGEVEGLIPLQRIHVVGRLRTGAAALTGNPILDLMEITRVQR